MQTRTTTAFLFLLTVGLNACGSRGPSQPTYEDLIDMGWQAFAAREYDQAVLHFTDAKASNPARIDAYVGLGWSLMKLGRLDEASTEFATGSSESDATADLFAGWAFVLNALKNFSLSNVRADQALAADPAWEFTHGLPLSVRDLHVLKAANFFLLGDFARSLQAVQQVNAAFQADLNTSEGIAALAAEIERLQSSGT